MFKINVGSSNRSINMESLKRGDTFMFLGDAVYYVIKNHPKTLHLEAVVINKITNSINYRNYHYKDLRRDESFEGYYLEKRFQRCEIEGLSVRLLGN